MTTLVAVIDALQTAGGNVSGIKSAPDEPPEQAGAFPFFVTYPPAALIIQQPVGSMTSFWDIVCQLHVARQGTLPNEISLLLSYAESIPEVLYETLNGLSVGQEDGEIEVTFGPLKWGDVETIGFTWTLRRVKIITDFT